MPSSGGGGADRALTFGTFGFIRLGRGRNHISMLHISPDCCRLKFIVQTRATASGRPRLFRFTAETMAAVSMPK